MKFRFILELIGIIIILAVITSGTMLVVAYFMGRI